MSGQHEKPKLSPEQRAIHTLEAINDRIWGGDFEWTVNEEMPIVASAIRAAERSMVETLREIQNKLQEPIAINQNRSERLQHKLNECLYLVRDAIERADGRKPE